MSRFMDMESINSKLTSYQIAKEKGCTSSTLQRYRHDIKLQSP